MQIHSSIYQTGVSFFRETFSITLTQTQQKVLKVALFAFAALAIAYNLFRCYTGLKGVVETLQDYHESLKVEGPIEETKDEFLAGLQKHGSSIKKINLSLCSFADEIDDEILKEIATHCPHLEKLFLCRADITAKGLEHLKGLSSLRYLTFLNCKNLNDDCLEEVSGFPALEYLDINMCEKVSDQGIEHLKNLKTLQHLHLSKSIVATSQITDDSLKHISSFPSLKYLSIEGFNQYSDKGIAFISNIATLEALHLTLDGWITDDAFQSFEALSKLKYFYLWSEGLTDVGLASLKKIKNLEVLNLWGCKNITDKGLKELNDLPCLSKLFLDYDVRVQHASVLKPTIRVGLGTDDTIEKYWLRPWARG